MGLLLVVVILGVLVVIAMSGTELRLDMEPPGLPSSETATGAAAGPAPASPASPARPTDAARRAACEASYEAVVSALATEQAASGTPAQTVEELVRDGWLDPSVVTTEPGITLEAVDGAATGRVLVDGQPGPAGCALR